MNSRKSVFVKILKCVKCGQMSLYLQGLFSGLWGSRFQPFSYTAQHVTKGLSVTGPKVAFPRPCPGGTRMFLAMKRFLVLDICVPVTWILHRCLLDVCSCVFDHGACLQSLTLACHLRPVRGERRRRRRVRREVAARQLIFWRLCGSSVCTTGGSTARCWRSPCPPTACGGRVLSKEQERAKGLPMTTTTTRARSSPPPLPLPPRPRPHLSLQSRRPAKTRLHLSLISPLTEHTPTHPFFLPQSCVRCPVISPCPPPLIELE